MKQFYKLIQILIFDRISIALLIKKHCAFRKNNRDREF